MAASVVAPKPYMGAMYWSHSAGHKKPCGQPSERAGGEHNR